MASEFGPEWIARVASTSSATDHTRPGQERERGQGGDGGGPRVRAWSGVASRTQAAAPDSAGATASGEAGGTRGPPPAPDATTTKETGAPDATTAKDMGRRAPLTFGQRRH